MHDYLNEHQKHAVLALELLKKICDDENIKFYLLAGSALGAIRHKGMIPWDDDIDVGLRWKEWIRLRNILQNKSLDWDDFSYKDEEIDNSYPRLYGKILYKGKGCVDIFPIVKWTNKKIVGNILWMLKKRVVSFYVSSTNNINRGGETTKISLSNMNYHQFIFFLLHEIRCFAYSISNLVFERADYLRIATWIITRFENTNSDVCVNVYSIYSFEKEKILTSWLDSPTIVEYEGESYLTVGETDTYLRKLYGDYMTPVPVEERHGNHNVTF